MRTLVVSGEYPWPVNSGSRLRLASVLRGLGRCGPVDLFSALPTARRDIDPPVETVGLERVAVVHYDDRPPNGWGRVRTGLSRTTPFEVPRSDGGAALRQVARFATGHYDLVWYFGMRPWMLTGNSMVGPTILDLVDMEDQKIMARRAIPWTSGGGPRALVRQWAAQVFSGEEVRRWRRLQVQASTVVATTVLCSQLDAERAVASGMERVAVVPNGYREVAQPVGRIDVGDPPVLTFPGTLRYPPNADGARFLVDEVLPLLRASIPDVSVRLVGAFPPGLERLAAVGGVRLTGQVPDIDAELALADVLVVPLRFGSGTRLKVLEGFAQRIPVASTTLGAEGLGVESGVHLLLGDSPGQLAEACRQLLTDTALRQTVTDRAHRLFLEQFSDDVIEQAVADLATRVATGR